MQRAAALSILLLLLLALGLPARADMAEALRREFHAYSELGVVVVTDSTLKDLDRTMKDPAVRVLVLQVSPEAFPEPVAARVLDWVREGHTAWFYDARLAQLFGMRPYTLKPEQFRGRPEDGTIGEEVRRGMATVVLATGPHEVLTGVGQATIWLPEFERGAYGAVLPEGDTVPLLQFTADSPALAALRRDGRGLIVFKPLLWTKPLSGERFQLNLMEFSAGFGVPGTGGEGRNGNPPGPEAAWVEGRPAVPPAGAGSVVASPLPPVLPATPAPSPSPAALAPSPSPTPRPADPDKVFPDRIEISGEAPLQGRILNEEFRFETSSESLRVPREQVAWLTIRTPLDLDRLETRDGRKLAGFLMDEELHVALPSGARTVEKRQVLRIDFGVAP